MLSQKYTMNSASRQQAKDTEVWVNMINIHINEATRYMYIPTGDHSVS